MTMSKSDRKAAKLSAKAQAAAQGSLQADADQVELKGLVVETSLQLGTETTRRKRKRETIVPELEVDISAPEPPSKKALRKAKKSKTDKILNVKPAIEVRDSSDSDSDSDAAQHEKRSEYGIWIGNLPWTADKTAVKNFIIESSSIKAESITRIHLPPPAPNAPGFAAANRQRVKPQNKGFAYVDLKSKEEVAAAIELSELLLGGRRVLIKDSKSFEGRPAQDKEEASAAGAGVAGKVSEKPANERIFVGNLGFETTEEDLREHYKHCGEISNVHVATFEDTGKCKGYAWVTFSEITAAEAAVRGWLKIPADTAEGGSDAEVSASEDDTPKSKGKRMRKWWVNRMRGRPLRMEFAEDKVTRYKKRFTKRGPDARGREGDTGAVVDVNLAVDADQGEELVQKPARHVRRPKLERRVDARTIKPGAALANAPRLTGGIVASEGKKITFE